MSKQNSRSYRLMILAVLLFVVVFLIFVFMPGKTTTVTEERAEDVTQYLDCNIKGAEHPLLGDVKDDIDFNVKIKFLNDKVANLNLKISKDFKDEALAESFVNEIHANFDIYKGKNDIPSKGLTPSYNYVDGSGRMTLFMDGSSLNYKTAPLMMLDNEVVNNIAIDNFSEYYKKNGFSCDEK